MTSIEDECFEACGFRPIDIPDGVTYIGSSAFWTTLLVDVVIPDGVTVLADSVLEACSDLETVTLGADLTEIGDYVLENCPELCEVFFKGTVAQWEAIPKGMIFVYAKAHPGALHRRGYHSV